MPDYLSMVKEKEEELRGLDKRMQQDADLLTLKKYVLTDAKNKAVPNIINITLNKPAIFGATVISTMGHTLQQTIVESEDKGLDTHKIEEFQKAAFNAANARLQKLPGQSLLAPFADEQLCFRGRTARRVLFQMVDGVLIPDITPWDGRYIRFEASQGGLSWAAYLTTRSKARIQDEYGITVKGKEGKVLDVWDKTHNEVWIDEKKILEQKHDYGFTPVVIQIVNLGYGSSLLDKNRLEHEGESIFFLIRDLVPELNRLASILQTLNMLAVKAPMVSRRKGAAEAPEYEVATGLGTITAMDVGEDIAPINYGDAKKSAEMLYGIMEKALQEGSITSIDLGNLQFPLSAVALVELGEGRDQVLLPRLQAKALLDQATAEMFTRQVIQIGGTVELGVPGHKKTFSTKGLVGEYETTYKFTSKSPKTEIARMAQAEQAKEFFSRETILKDVLQVEDYEGEMRKKYSDMAEEVDPLVLRHRIITSQLKLAEEGDENAAIEAMIMAATLGMSIKQILSGQVAPQVKQPAQAAGKPAMPLLGEGGKVGGIPPAAVERTPELAMTAV